MKNVFQRTGLLQPSLALVLLICFLAVAVSIASTGKNPRPAPTPKAQQHLPDPSLEEQKVGFATTTLSTILTGGNARRKVLQRGTGIASSQASQAVQQWLNQFGTAKVNINVNNNFAMQESALDWLLPLYDNKRNLFFTQLGARRIDNRNILNLGWGWRSEIGNWLYGFNHFVDHDYVHDNWRTSIGLEAWTNYLQLSANRYMRMSGWHQSMEFADYNERPAGGFDLRMNSYLPAYPQLGSHLMFEKYFGNQVALFGSDNLQQNPYAFTFGLNYTPIPLLTFGVDQKLGMEGKNDTNINMQLTYRFNDTLSRQLSTAEVDAIRRLSKSRYDLVDRNNNIVLEYEKQTLITLSLEPTEITGMPGNKAVVTATVDSKYPLSSIQWSAPDFLAAPAASITQITPTTFEINIPSYVPGGGSTRNVSQQSTSQQSLPDNHYQLVATAYDINGNPSNLVNLLVNVTYPSVTMSTNNLAVVVNNSPANNSATNQVSATLRDGANNPLPGAIVTFTANNSATVLTPTVSTNSSGVAIARLTNTVAGTTTVTASVNNTSASINTTFIPNATTATILASNMTVTSNNALANNIATNAVQVLVTDAYNNPVPSVSVSFTANNGATIVTTPVVTDANGIASTTLRNTHAGTTAVTATVNGHSQSVNTTFVANSATATLTSLTVTRNNAVANNVATNAVEVLVTDQYLNPLSGFVVTYTATNSATVVTSSVTSNASGIAATTLRSTKAGNSSVTATLAATSLNGTVTFVADSSTASVTLSVLTNNAIADGVEEDQVQVTVVDANNNPVNDLAVTFSATNSATTTPTTANTNASGQLTSDFTNNNGSGGGSTVTARLPNGNTATASINFTGLTLTGINTPTNPRLYAVTDGFPTTASQGLSFQFQINNLTTHNSKFTWTSNKSSVASINSSGTVTFQSQPTGGVGGSITFTGTLTTNSSYTVSYTATLDQWFYNRGTFSSTFVNTQNYCNGQPNSQGLTGASNLSSRGGSRGVGGFYDEWGNLASYGNGWQSNNSYWSNTYNAALPTGYWVANLGTGSKTVWLIGSSGYMVCASGSF